MYATHAPRISAYALSGPDALLDTGAFVLASIRVPLWRAAADMARIRAGDLTPYYMRRKREGYDFLRGHALSLYRDALALRGDTAALLLHFARIPGLGLAKAGFLVQLAFGAGGCLDTHNLRRFGIPPHRFVIRERDSAELRERKAREYVDTCEALGGAPGLWDTWCTYVATETRDAARYRDAFDVSATHCAALALPTGV